MCLAFGSKKRNSNGYEKPRAFTQPYWGELPAPMPLLSDGQPPKHSEQHTYRGNHHGMHTEKLWSGFSRGFGGFGGGNGGDGGGGGGGDGGVQDHSPTDCIMEAAGLASSILTFIDISYKIAKGTYEIYKSATGATAENAHVSNVITDLQRATAELGPSSNERHDPELAHLSEQCRGLSNDLLKLLARLERREKKLLQSFKAAVVGARKQKDIASIERRLDQYRQQILLHLTLSISRFENEHAAKLDALHNQLSEVLESMQKEKSRPFSEEQKPIDWYRNEPHSQLDNVLHRDDPAEETARKTCHGTSITDQADEISPYVNDLKDLARLINDLKSLTNVVQVENKILENFVRETLAECANGRKLVLVNTFFWNSGLPLQKSLEGFYRTILFHTLRQCPELLDKVFPNPIGTASSPLQVGISLSELKAAFSRLQSLRNTAGYLFCYFVDGLDEYEGDPLEQKILAKMLQAWARADNIKIICSARPSNVIVDIFGADETFFNLHHLTKADIHNFAKTQFEEHLTEPKFKQGQTACLQMTQIIAENANGVFLWASLVVRALLNAALEHEDETSLRKRLEECPKDLNQLFHRMLYSINTSPSSQRQRYDFSTVPVQKLEDVVCDVKDSSEESSKRSRSSPRLVQKIWIPKYFMFMYQTLQWEGDSREWGPFSFLHLAAIYGATEYVEKTITRMDNPTSVDAFGTNLLYSASNSSDLNLVGLLLERGWNPNNYVSAWSSATSGEVSVSVWEAFLCDLVMQLGIHPRISSQGSFCRPKFEAPLPLMTHTLSILEKLLRYGVDVKVEVLIEEYDYRGYPKNPRPESQGQIPPKSLFRISLTQILQILQMMKPKNLVELESLLLSASETKKKGFTRILSRIGSRKPQKLPELASYPPVAMDDFLIKRWKPAGIVSLGGSRVVLDFYPKMI
ncbi:hypothetical protein CORC01_11893 [Colletotrichum orchidophilum]|uniref:Nephrocystin 3-like N-terminal domain-containing protein n=1 Tax=Colletotrichum orchidophilum TaxID=1209926 RepID=A0A1G4AUM9_9PEZI|nr:uncharacterized protein CORC01_11893 [Colletotrichum orchidophilum]OHE92815.1 hypothetical protein CORC01_11893 [Colletotrichum orchidophilum]